MQLLRVHDDTLKAAIEKFDGKIIKAIGDAFMVDFSSAVNAVKCAIESQENFYTYNIGKSEIEKLEIRIGIHLGDVIADGNDIFGDGVNIAARIEAVTEPNRICISQDVYSQIKNKMQVKTFHMGSIDLKNIPEPVAVYEILLDHIPEFATPSKSAQQMPSKRTADRTIKREAKEAETIQIAKTKADDDQWKTEQDTAEKVQKLMSKAEAFAEEGKSEAAEKQLNEILELVAFHAGAQMLQARLEKEKHKKSDEEKKKSAGQRRVKQQIGELMEVALRLADDGKLAEARERLREIFDIDAEDEDAKALEAKLQEEIRKQPPQESEKEAEPVPEEQAGWIPAPEHLETAPVRPEWEIPVQPKRRRRRRGLTQKRKEIFPTIRNWIIVAAIAILGYIFFPAIQRAILPRDTSIVVIPFAFAGGEADTAGVGAAIASVLEEDLAGFKELVVVRTGNLERKGFTPAQLATALEARCYISGQIVSLSPRFSARLRISVAGENGSTEEWTVEGDPYSLKMLRSGVVSRVFQRMGLETESKELESLSGNPVINDLYLRAASKVNRFNLNDVSSADSLFREILLMDRSFAPAYSGLGRALVRLFKIDGERDKSLLREAVDVAIKARGISPNSSAAFEVLGTAYRAAGRRGLAAKTLEQLLEIAPGNAQAQRQLSLLALVEGDHDAAFTFASKAMLLDPNNPESHEVMGHAFFFRQQMTSAEREYDQAIALGSSSYFITTRYKLAVWGAGLSPEPVVQYCNRLLRGDSTSYVVRYWIGRAYMLSGIWSEAKKYLEPGAEALKQILKFSPSDVNAHAYLGLYYARLGESANGLGEIAKAMELSGQSAITMYRKAQFYAIQTGKQAEALEWLQKAIRQEYILAEVMNPDFAFLLKDPEFRQAIALRATAEGGE
jgi:tetratricopeptide (TPR) repeat protein